MSSQENVDSELSGSECCPEEALDALRWQVEVMRKEKLQKAANDAQVQEDFPDSPTIQSSGSEYIAQAVDLNSSDSEYRENLKETPRKGSDTSDSDDEILAMVQQKMAAAKKRLFCNTGPVSDTTQASTSRGEEREHDGHLADDENMDNAESNVGKERRSRKRTRQENTWKRNVSKRLRTSGEAYVSSSGKQIKARQMKAGCGDKCRYKCHQNFPENERIEIFRSFWSREDKKDQRHFIASCVTKDGVKRKRVGSDRRGTTYHYTFYAPNGKQEVCKKFFLDTLDLGQDVVYSTLNRLNPTGTLSPSKQGKHGKQPTVDSDVLQSIRDHINLFPTLESHYNRKHSSKKYLPADLSLSGMYRLYKEKCRDDHVKAAKECTYRKVFNSEYNLAFHRPKKDQCDDCASFRNKQFPTAEETEQHELHQQNKNAAREVKDQAKQKAMTGDGSTAAACFDFQKILTCPHGQVSNFYYKRKLGVFNFTVYDLGTSDAICYMWPENEARRGPNEVGSCIWDFISQKVEAGAKSIHFFSDNCGGQNRNRFIAFMYMQAMRHFGVNIRHTYLEKGHTQTENDSVHAVIENSVKRALIYTPEQWYGAVRSARKSKQPYIVKEREFEDFIDFKAMSTSVRNLTVHDDKTKVKWTQVKEIVADQEDPGAIFLRYKFGEQPKRLDVVKRVPKGDEDKEEIELQYLTKQCGIHEAKKKDLLSLCYSHLIPKKYISTFEELSLRYVSDNSEEEESD